MQLSKQHGRADVKTEGITRLLLLLLLLAACTSDQSSAPSDPGPSQRELYLDTLAEDPQAFRILSARWSEQGEAALASPLAVELPYVEYQVIRPQDLVAAAYSFFLDVDEILEIEVRRGPGATGVLIVELLRSNGAGWDSVASLKPTESIFNFRPEVAGDYAVRAQASLGSSGVQAIGLVSKTILEFPVLTDSKQSVLSFFGAERDAGRRQHHGIDIFAPRGTPVLAAHDGHIARVGESPKGGLHVWQRSAEGSLYYAHLDSVAVESGDLVSRGELIGGVGNSGNARTTNPHLHFGVYQRWKGPQDPLPLTGSYRIPDPWLDSMPAQPRWLLSRSDTLTLRSTLSQAAKTAEQVSGGQLVRVLARSGSWMRVVSASGIQGYAPEQELRVPGRTQARMDFPSVLHQGPSVDSPELLRIPSGMPFIAKGQFGDFTWVETESGLTGWLRALPNPAET